MLHSSDMLTLIALGVYQLFPLLLPFSTCHKTTNPYKLLCSTWALAITLAMVINIPLTIVNIRNEAAGRGVLVRFSTITRLAVTAVLLTAGVLLAILQVATVVYVTNRQTGLGRKHSAVTRSASTIAALITVLLTTLAACVVSTPMLYFLDKARRLSRDEKNRQAAISLGKLLEMAEVFMIARLLLLISPLANPVLIAVRYRLFSSKAGNGGVKPVKNNLRWITITTAENHKLNKTSWRPGKWISECLITIPCTLNIPRYMPINLFEDNAYRHYNESPRFWPN